ncbi:MULTISPECIES: hypothetical protein [unclassified Deinococcus]|uniref:hypothetical protein n=1 Tax=unclassified Deinococcus TaxID=2623546 RepID=UPI0006DC7216|nr:MULTISPECIES: hypothetical protein [unclassified Deinococcus]MBX8465259.1 hypothetical protein [Deinococcus sp. RIT780]MCD0163178.1 hypothetical protein [Deinococcus sp. 6YEL10]PIH00148.1 hypothetical protein AMD26_000810 [Deinococcus sp. UR1]
MKDEVTISTAATPAAPAPATAMTRVTHDLKGLTRDVEALRGDLRALADTPHLEELLRLIPRPGWTTPAELELVRSGVAQLSSQVKLLRVAQDNLLRGAQLVGRT